MSDLLNLPDDIFEHLFSYLNAKDVLRFEATSTRSCELASIFYWSNFTSLNLITFLRCNSKIDVTSAYKFDAAAAGLIKRVGKKLVSLNLSKFGPLEYGLRLGLENAVIEHCRNLQVLELNGRLLESSWLLQVSAATLHLKCVSLNHVYLRNYGELDDKHLAAVSKNWRKLERLSVRDNKNVKMSCSACLPTTLNFLDVQGCSIGLFHLQQLLKRCATLESLCVTYPPGLELLEPSTLENIRRLDVDSASVPSLVGEDLFSRGLPLLTNLRSLSVCSHLMTDVMFKTIGTFLINLREISFPGARRGFVTSSTHALLELTRLPHLKKIHLRANGIGRTLLLMCFKFARLEEIDVSYVIKEREFVDAWQAVRSESLEVLIMRGFCAPTQNAQEIIARLMESLKHTCPSLSKIIVI